LLSDHKDALAPFEDLIDLDGVFYFGVLEFLQVLWEFGVRVLEDFEGNWHPEIDMDGIVDKVGASVGEW